jgi:methyltransferase
MYFILFISFVVLQWLLELLVAKGNEKWARNQGAVEYGQKHCHISFYCIRFSLLP